MILPIIMAAGWGLLVAGLGAWLTELTPWYYALRKPSWQPPDWLFGPAWTVILTLASISFYLAWNAAATASASLMVAGLFVTNAVLNILWSPMFFTWRRPDLALIEVPLLWLSILAPILLLWPLSPTASLLLVPYLLWVSFATVLNIAIVRLNGPFAAR